MKKFYPEYNRRAFALIYVLLFCVLISLTVFTVWAASMSEVRLARRNENSSQAYQLAKSAIDEGWTQYKAAVGSGIDTNKSFPDTAACNSTNPKVSRYEMASGSVSTPNLQTLPSLDVQKDGVFDFRVCGTSLIIEGVGYFQGSKITLKGLIVHPAGEETCDTSITPPICTSDHSNDTLNIEQVGPSS